MGMVSVLPCRLAMIKRNAAELNVNIAHRIHYRKLQKGHIAVLRRGIHLSQGTRAKAETCRSREDKEGKRYHHVPALNRRALGSSSKNPPALRRKSSH